MMAQKTFNLLRPDADYENKLASSGSKPYYKVIGYATHC